MREEGGVATVKVTRLRGSHGRVTVQYVTEMLTATEGVDYVGAGGELALADGVSEAEINITLKDDTNMEQLESFRVTISNVTGKSLYLLLNVDQVYFRMSLYITIIVYWRDG